MKKAALILVFVLVCACCVAAWDTQTNEMSDALRLIALLKRVQAIERRSNIEDRGSEFLNKLIGERSGKAATETVDAPVSDVHLFMKALLMEGTSAQTLNKKAEDVTPQSIHRVSDSTGRLQFTEVEVGSLSRHSLDTDDVFIVDTTEKVYVWMGRGATTDERRNAFNYAHQYLLTTTHPSIPITIVREDTETKQFQAALS